MNIGDFVFKRTIGDISLIGVDPIVEEDDAGLAFAVIGEAYVAKECAKGRV